MTVRNGSNSADTLFGLGNDVVFGFGGNDTIYGNGNNNDLNGGWGNDIIYGSGSDFINYSNDFAQGGTSGVSIYLNNGYAVDGWGSIDNISGIQHAVGTRFSDVLVGNSGNNNLFGLAGSDYLQGGGGNDELYGGDDSDTLDGGAGADYLNGGSGFDYVTYAYAQSGVFASIASPGSNTGEAAGDTYVSIEALVGSFGDDTLVTSRQGNNQLWGGSGNDSLYALGGRNYISGGNGVDSIYSTGGYNQIDGGAGFDVVRYDYSPTGVTATLDPSAIYNAGGAVGDTYSNIEGLTGSDFSDILVGDASNNHLYGRAGADTLFGGAGVDALYGGTGNNNLTGGAGDDYFSFYSNDLQAGSHNYILDFSSSFANADHLYLIGVSPGNVNFVATNSGTDVYIAVGWGVAVLHLNGAITSNVISQTDFF